MNFNKTELFKNDSGMPIETLPEFDENSEEVKNSNIIIEIINRAKEFLKSKAIDLKLGAMVLISMGSMEMANAQEDDMVKYHKAIEDVQSGKNKIENVINSFYESYKKSNIDSTYYIHEYSLSEKNGSGLYVKDNKVSKLIEVNLGDTTSLGDVEVKRFTVWMKCALDYWENGTQDIQSQNNHRVLSGIKINLENKDGIQNQQEKSNIGYGDTKEKAIISAISNVAMIKGVLVKSIVGKESETEKNMDSFSSEAKFITLSTLESHEILRDVRIIVKEMSDIEYREYFEKGMISDKEVREHNRGLSKENHVSNKTPKKGSSKYYSAEVIYSEQDPLGLA